MDLSRKPLTGMPLTSQSRLNFKPIWALQFPGNAVSQSAGDGPSSGWEQTYITHYPEWKCHGAHFILLWQFLGNRPSSPLATKISWWFGNSTFFRKFSSCMISLIQDHKYLLIFFSVPVVVIVVNWMKIFVFLLVDFLLHSPDFPIFTAMWNFRKSSF